MTHKSTSDRCLGAQVPLKYRDLGLPPRSLWSSVGILFLVTLLLYLPTCNHGFINYDDKDYVTENPHVLVGLNPANVQWAFTTFHASNWHPLTWISHMCDVSWWGLNARCHHAVNALLHALNSGLTFVLARRLLKSDWMALFLAALFAVHPLRVESVAWISERKDLLAGLFGLLTLLAYVYYASVPAGHNTKSKWYYSLAFLFFTLGLLSKPMLVTWPALLLLLDFGPLRRILSTARPAGIRFILLEKLPFVAFSLASCVVTLIAQNRGGAVASLVHVSPMDRLANALVSYVRYIWKMCWPADLAVFYPEATKMPAHFVLGAGLLLASVTLLTWRERKRKPLLFFGWMWYLITLLPVIGIVQVGSQSMADRYSYLPTIGLLLAGLPIAVTLLHKLRLPSVVVATFGVLLLGTWLRATIIQAAYWKDSVSLFTHALKVTPPNYMSHYHLGNALIESGQAVEGMKHLREAAQLNPSFPNAYTSLAFAFGIQGDYIHAASNYWKALDIRPAFPEALNNLAWILATCPDKSVRNGNEAVRLAKQATELSPEPQFLGTLAAAYAEANRFPEAVATAKRAADLARSLGLQKLAENNEQLRQVYETGTAYREVRQ